MDNVSHYSFSFGYDPIDKQFKILRITTLYEYDTQNSSQYQVLTLGGARKKNLLWRNIQCCTNHYPYMSHDDNKICISGVLYYPAGCYKGKRHCVAIACFDVRSESFSFINVDLEDMTAEKISSYSFALIDYKGKLGACNCDTYKNLFELWVLENAEEHKWSKYLYQMPQLSVMISAVRAAGMIASGEIVLHPSYSVVHFFVLYYNLERNIITRVRLEVPLMVSGCWVHAFANYLEDLKLM
ncbi:putative F-box protein At1g53550 [Arabidopsis lyrata subsp. lyrata]|nr:putative F-box protein At1g53550 [Arabidopsis lyrata subsp. lyrata]|eukprot:XP_020867198.1 putative F-box protein At1g53550 [Arabidopsis lyrata subsp. lyrata]